MVTDFKKEPRGKRRLSKFRTPEPLLLSSSVAKPARSTKFWTWRMISHGCGVAETDLNAAVRGSAATASRF